jgi:hypothetical protein
MKVMALLETPFSELINKPVRTVERLTGSTAHSLRLRRRDDDDLVLTTATRYEQDHAVLNAAIRLFVALLRDGDAESYMLRVLPDVFPWTRFLPGDESQDFLNELVGTLLAAGDLDNLAPVAQIIHEWRHTAEVHADPELAAALRQEAADHGVVQPPIAH